jgi:hypothetical protein
VNGDAELVVWCDYRKGGDNESGDGEGGRSCYPHSTSPPFRSRAVARCRVGKTVCRV